MTLSATYSFLAFTPLKKKTLPIVAPLNVCQKPGFPGTAYATKILLRGNEHAISMIVLV